MVDFLTIATRSTKRGVIEIYPKFIIKKSSDLMIRGGDFYAIWLEEKGIWSTDEDDVTQLIDRELVKFEEENRNRFDGNTQILYMWDAQSGMIDAWHKYCQRQMRDSFTMLDEKLVFSNTPTNKKDYASKILPYPLEEGDCHSFKRLISTLYSDEERHKIEWAIGSIVSGESKFLQKFMVLYGSAGTGKSTILNIVQQLFDGYYSVFDAKALGSSSNSFALEAFKTNPLVAIQHDGDLSRIEDNTRLNSLVSHELMTVNEKFKSTYSNRFKCFLFMGTNKPVKITDAKSGLIRRLIDVSPSGNKLSPKEYSSIVKKIKFELGAIAYYCMQVYLDNPDYYNDYIPVSMLGASNDFYNFVIDSYHVFKKEDGTTLKAAWEMYKVYCEEARVSYPFSQRVFKEELRNYFRGYNDRFNFTDGTRVRSYYIGFRTDKFEENVDDIEPIEDKKTGWLDLSSSLSVFDKVGLEYQAQYATAEDTPSKAWDNVKTRLSDLDTSKVHYVRPPENHIVIDFDIVDEHGNKSLEKNIMEANKFPPTYAEISKGGNGIHLHYIYTGDVNKLSSVYDDKIEIKIHTGKRALRRKLSKCNSLNIASINSGLPFREEKQMINFDRVKNEKGIRTLIKRNLNKEYLPGTKPSIDFIHKILEDAYASGVKYDVTSMRNHILAFASNSTNQARYCIKKVNSMKFKSEDEDATIDVREDEPIVFYDVEVFKNLFVVVYKKLTPDRSASKIALVNPTPKEIEDLLKFRLVGFNCRRYDNHILYGRLIGYTNKQLYNLSQRIINNESGCFFSEAYNISYTDIYDFSSKKQSLKKFEIELGLVHKELGLPWDLDVEENMIESVVDYCGIDVDATEATFHAREADFVARKMLADIADGSVNDTTNSLTTKIIFGKNRNPQNQFNYRNMGEVTPDCVPMTITDDMVLFDGFGDEYTLFNDKGQPVFPGYKYEFGKSTYRGEEVGEGGNVYAEPGIHDLVALLDIMSMHPFSIIAENLFGPYTQRFKDLVDARIYIKHGDLENARKMLGGVLAKYLVDEDLAKQLSTVLKIPINSVYGLTAASFPNAFRDPRNKDNIVAKRGALFMVNLKHLVQSKGFTVAHIKTDSIKIPNATPEIIQFVMDYGKQYGYTFEYEDDYLKMCLVNDAVYIAKYMKPKIDKKTKKEIHWTATGTQFAVPYVFKTLFSKESIKFTDLCETKSVNGALYLDMNEKLAENEHNYIFVGKVGQFCPIKQGCGGGVLYREKDGKYYAATGTKGYRWLESEMVKNLNKEDDIDLEYYDVLVNNAINTISKFGDYEKFIS